MTHGLTDEEVIALLEENSKLKKRLEVVKRVSVFGARMDVHPTRMGGSAEALEEAMWWQSWLIRFDESWRERLKRALEDEDPDPSRF